MDEIARDANVSKGGLYRHFPSKDELFLEVAIGMAGELHGILQEAGARHAASPAFQQVSAYVGATITFARERGDQMNIISECGEVEYLIDHNSPSFAEYKRAMGALADLGSDALKRGQADRSVRSDVPLEHLAASLAGAVHGVVQLELRSEEVRRRLQLPTTPTTDVVNLVTQLVRAP